MTRVVPTTVRREHNNKISKFWVDTDRETENTHPFALAESCRNYFNNQILEVAQNLWKNYHFIGSTDRISVFYDIYYFYMVSDPTHPLLPQTGLTVQF